jgi:hypothetical protein
MVGLTGSLKSELAALAQLRAAFELFLEFAEGVRVDETELMWRMFAGNRLTVEPLSQSWVECLPDVARVKSLRHRGRAVTDCR